MSGDGAGTRVLVVEDDYLLATDLQQQLAAKGFVVCGPFARADAAISALESQSPSAALLDINLGRGPTFEVASALEARSIPFAFVTGYDSVPEEWGHVPCLTKPIEADDVEQLLRRLLL